MQTQILTSNQGGELTSFKLNGIEKIHQGKNILDENGKIYWNKYAPVLFPIVGKLRKNQSIINGRIYEIFQHGFARDLEFEPITKLDNFHSYILKSNKNTKSRYPFDFELYTTYRLDQNKLTVIYKVINTDKVNMPFCIGGQPAFKIDKEKLKNGDYYLEFDETEEKIHFLYLVDGLVGTDYAKNVLINKKTINLDNNTFKNDALIMKGIKSKNISLKDKVEDKTLITMNFEEFPYLAIWSKPGAPFICISPWKGTADTVKSSGIFTEKTGMINIKPGESYECRYIIEFFE